MKEETEAWRSLVNFPFPLHRNSGAKLNPKSLTFLVLKLPLAGSPSQHQTVSENLLLLPRPPQLLSSAPPGGVPLRTLFPYRYKRRNLDLETALKWAILVTLSLWWPHNNFLTFSQCKRNIQGISNDISREFQTPDQCCTNNGEKWIVLRA